MKIVLLLIISLYFISCHTEPRHDIEKHIITEAENTYSRILIGEENIDSLVVFPIITDLHSGGNDKYQHIGYIATIEHFFNFDFVVNLGDIGLNVKSTNATTTQASSFLEKIAKQHEKFNSPVIFVKGNHDMDGGENTYLSEYILSKYLQEPSQKKYPNIRLVKNKAYGFMDISKKNIRVIFLDSNDNNGKHGGYSYHASQLEWLITTLYSTPENFHIVLLSHRFPDEMGNWYQEYRPTIHKNRVKNEIPLKKILTSYIKKDRGEIVSDEHISLKWDFSKSESKISGILCGDSHFDVAKNLDGLNIIATQGYGSIAKSQIPPHAIITPFDFNYEILIDIVVIKPSTRQIKYFRMGAGGSNRDRTFTY